MRDAELANAFGGGDRSRADDMKITRPTNLSMFAFPLLASFVYQEAPTWPGLIGALVAGVLAAQISLYYLFAKRPVVFPSTLMKSAIALSAAGGIAGASFEGGPFREGMVVVTLVVGLLAYLRNFSIERRA